MHSINFTTRVVEINGWQIIILPKDASSKLPSRGQAMVKGTINGTSFQTPLEPDGKGSHWFKLDSKLVTKLSIKTGDKIILDFDIVKDWPNPEVPKDVMRAIESSKSVHALWQDITPLARWEWVRWIRSTGRDETRKRRIEVACSKLSKGMRRPCCWNRNLCTEPSVSKNGVLIDPN